GACHGNGYAWLELARRDPADRAAADRAVRWYSRAVEACGGSGHVYWSTYTLGLAESLRRAGDPDLSRTRELGRSALRAHARQVLAQAGTEYAMQSAREAAADADRVAGWCLRDGAYEE